MNIQDIKATISESTGIIIKSLDMKRQTKNDPSGSIDTATNKVAQLPEPWFSYWDNTARLRIVMHEDVYNQLHVAKAQGQLMTVTGLALKNYSGKPFEIVIPTDATKPTYKRAVVITPMIDDSF